jgi:DNA-binding CsgD family transcriptional regulator
MDESANLISATRDVARAVADLRDGRQVARVVAGHTGELLRADQVAIFQWDESVQSLVPIYVSPETSTMSPTRRGSGVVGAAFEQRRPVVVQDDSSAHYESPGALTHRARAIAVVPIVFVGEAIGALYAARFQMPAFSDADVSALLLLGTLGVGPVLSTARVRRRLHELEAENARLHAKIEAARSLQISAEQLLGDVKETDPIATPGLTSRELEILPLLARGYTNREIASVMRVTPGTARNTVARLLSKLGARDRTHAVVIALSMGLLRR